MIFKHNHKYYQQKIRIDKASNRNTAYTIQIYADKLVDNFVESFNSNESTTRPLESVLFSELSILNRPDVYRNYQRIINSKYTSNDAINNLLLKIKANKDLNRIVEAEVERISKNLDYVEKVLQSYEIPLKEYDKLLKEQKNRSVGNRQQILKEVAYQNNELLRSEGLNIPSNVFTYRNIEATAENLLRQSQMISQHEKIHAINDNYINEGKDAIYNGKEWIWTHGGQTTRHASNHLQKRKLDEPFIITNDKTLEIDELMYPSDPSGGFGNTFICYCEVEYLTEGVDDLGYKVTLPSSNTVKPTPVTAKPTTTPVTTSKPIMPSTLGVKEPTKQQLKENLTATERAKYSNYERNIKNHEQWLNDNPNADVKLINNRRQKLETARKNLEDLRLKALGTPKTEPVTPTVKTEPIKPKNTPTTTKEPETQTINLTPEQLKTNLTPTELKRYKRYQKEIKGNEISDTMKARRIKDLENLKRKAVGLKPIENTPIKTPNKPQQEPEQKGTGKELDKLQKPTHEQLHSNLTKNELKEYLDHRDMIKWAENVLENPNMKPKQKAYAQKQLNETLPKFKKLNDKALGLKTKTEKTTVKRERKPKAQKVKIELNKPKNARLTKEETNSLTFDQLAEHHNAKYKGLNKGEDGKQYHTFEQSFDNGETFKVYIEKAAVNSYKKGGVATANEILHEVYKVPEVLRKETNNIYFKNTQGSRQTNVKGKYKAFGQSVGGHNVSYNRSLRSARVQEVSKKFKGHEDPNHRIGINPKYFKEGTKFTDIITWRSPVIKIQDWKKTLHHEFWHSIQDSRKIWKNGELELHNRKDYINIEKKEPYFTQYANTMTSESFAEHGGYISYMLENPAEQSRKITIRRYDKNKNGRTEVIEEGIDFEEYKKRYPEHYKYFTNIIKNGVK